MAKNHYKSIGHSGEGVRSPLISKVLQVIAPSAYQ